jgi:hypothetical protein
VPYAVGAAVIGLPLGILLGRGAYRFFAQSLAVLDAPTTSIAMLAALLGAVLLATVLAALVGIAVARRGRSAAVLHEG